MYEIFICPPDLAFEYEYKFSNQIYEDNLDLVCSHTKPCIVYTLVLCIVICS